MMDLVAEEAVGAVWYFYDGRAIPLAPPTEAELTFTWWRLPHPCGGMWNPGPTYDS